MKEGGWQRRSLVIFVIMATFCAVSVSMGIWTNTRNYHCISDPQKNKRGHDDLSFVNRHVQDVPVVTIYLKNCPVCPSEHPDNYKTCIARFPQKCPTFLKVALLQAKEYNRKVILLEEGEECRQWALKSGITWQKVPLEIINEAICPMRAERSSLVSIRRADTVWSTAFSRWLILNKFAQGQFPNQTIAPPRRFNLIDHDFMTYIDSSVFFDRYGDAEVAICCYYPLCNGIYSLFTTESIADLARWAHHYRDHDDMTMLLSYANQGVPQNELECWADGYVWPQGSITQGNCEVSRQKYESVFAGKEMPYAPAFPVVNSCLSFPDGRIFEVIALDREGIYESMRHGHHKLVHGTDSYQVVVLEKENVTKSKIHHWQLGRALYYRNGHLHFKLKTNSSLRSHKWVPPSRQAYERALGVHFQGGYKNHMKFHFRPNMRSVKSRRCRECLESDCDCENIPCANCWNVCLSNCKVLREFEAALR